MNKNYTVIDLFAGCGGFSQGFQSAGFEIIAANERWEPAIETYILNHERVNFIEGDITLPEIKENLYKVAKDKQVNVIIGGFPCQGYSIAGNRNPDDPRGQLYLDFVEIVDHLKPDFFVMENVKGLLNMKHVIPNLTEKQLHFFKLNCQKLQRYKNLKRYGSQRELDEEEKKDFKEIQNSLKQIEESINSKLIPLLDKILDKFKEINYKVSWKLLNSADYGVAQTRERVIFIGTRHKNVKIKFPKKSHAESIEQTSITDFVSTQHGRNLKKWKTSASVLEFYEDWEEDIEKSHVFTKHSDKFIARIKATPIGKNVFKNYSDSWWRLDPNRPARTVKENHGGVFVHYKFDRVCTPRELAALQSFNDDFLFKGTKSGILVQIGNAVPPLMARAIAEEIKNSLDELY